MKMLLILAVLLGVAYYFFFSRQGQEAPAAPVAADIPSAPSPAAASAQTSGPANPANSSSFDGVTALLRQDLDAIPTALDGPGHLPANAIAIKRRVRPYLNVHGEYVIITQACDLIIRADAQRTTFQQSCHAEQSRASFDNALTVDHSPHSAQNNRHVPGNLLLQTPPPQTGPDAIHTRVESSWISYRAQTESQVQGLLAPLAGRHL